MLRFNNLAEAKYQWGARLDFFRGQASDDWANTCWSSLFRALTGYREHLARFRALPESDKGNGDAVEMLVGVAYACATEGALLPEGQCLAFDDPVAAIFRWTIVWEMLGELGIAATHPADRTLTPVASSSSAPRIVATRSVEYNACYHAAHAAAAAAAAAA